MNQQVSLFRTFIFKIDNKAIIFVLYERKEDGFNDFRWLGAW